MFVRTPSNVSLVLLVYVCPLCMFVSVCVCGVVI